MKNISNIVLATIVIVGGYIIYKKIDKIDKSNTKSHYTITPDTNVSKVKGLSKYVTQEEVNDFGFRYWDIDNNYTKNIKPNLLQLRTYLKQKNTNKVIEYIKDNNLSIDVKIQDGTTPLMYSSFYNDVNTSKYLINNKANVHQKDKYGLSPLAYAIENNSTKTVKLLLDSGVRFEEIDKVQAYLFTRHYGFIEKIEIDENNNTKIFYEYNDGDKNLNSKDGLNAMKYIIRRKYKIIAEEIFKRGYKNIHDWGYGQTLAGIDSNRTRKSPFSTLVDRPNYKPLLELLLKYNVYGKPTKEELKRAYDYCHKDFISEIKSYNDYIDKLKPNQILDKKTTTDDIIWKRRIDNYKKYCKENNSTFTIRDYFSWANEDEKVKQLFSFNRQHSTKVFYIKSNSTNQPIQLNAKE